MSDGPIKEIEVQPGEGPSELTVTFDQDWYARASDAMKQLGLFRGPVSGRDVINLTEYAIALTDLMRLRGIASNQEFRDVFFRGANLFLKRTGQLPSE